MEKHQEKRQPGSSAAPPSPAAPGSEVTHLLPEVHGETHVPDVTLAIVEASQDGHIGLVGLDVVHLVLHLAWLPAHDGVLAGLGRSSEEEQCECGGGS